MNQDGGIEAAARGPDPTPAPPDEKGERLESAIREIEAEFALVVGNPRRVEEACRLLAGQTLDPASLKLVPVCAERLIPLLQKRQGAVAVVLFSFFEEQARRVEDPRPLALGLLAARDDTLRRRGIDLTLRLVEEGRAIIDSEVAGALAALWETGPELREDAGILYRLENCLRNLELPVVSPGGDDPLERLLTAEVPPAVRYLAAAILDRGGEPVACERASRLLGAEAAEVLGPYWEYTRATHRNLVDLTPEGRLSPTILDSIRRAEGLLGRPLLGVVIAELGWERLTWGISAERLIGLSIEGNQAIVVTPSEASLLESRGPTRRIWDRFLIIAHGGTAAGGNQGGQEDAAVQRFRRYNVLHAELLAEILEVAPLTPAKIGRILSRLDQVVEHFTALFQGQAEDAARVGEVYARLKAVIVSLIHRTPEDQPLAAEVTRLVQMFEDPVRLDEVRTLHGLKRYLHQQGLRHAFRVFRSGRATNRTVDLALTSSSRILHRVRRIRYIDFEPEPEAGDLPFAVALVVEALGRRLLHGRPEAPDMEILVYGNEVQAYVSFRNHPVFLRLDLSPPQRGGMIDLEYFGVSQYELDQHPDLSLRWIQRVFRRLGFDVQAQDYRLHVRYDKERAFEFGDLIQRTRLLCSLLPHLMELDWSVASLNYPDPIKAVIADGWADRLTLWGWLPTSEVLTKDRSRVLLAVTIDPAGEREVPWDGRGPYRDRFSESVDHESAQLSLEARLLEPLREAAALGTARENPPLHEAECLARILADQGADLLRSMRVALVVASIERHLRFLDTGSLQGYPVQRAELLLRGQRVELSVLRDVDGIVRLARAVERPFHIWPGPPNLSLYKNGSEVECAELMRRLRRDNYLTPGYEPSLEIAFDIEAVTSAFAVPNPLASHRPDPEDRMVQGIVASPGKAAGFARFGAEGRTADELEGGVLFAPAIRPQDAPLIRRSAGLVSTGGGILSHAGLIALELHKPALLIPGRWDLDATGGGRLTYRILNYQEEEKTIGPYRILIRRDLCEREETLREGDLVALDAEVGTLSVLGSDRDALALQQELGHLASTTEILASADGGSQTLVLRGRWLRAIHQLKKVLNRITRMSLARHAVRELLVPREPQTASPRLGDIGGLLRVLFENRTFGPMAQEEARRQHTELIRRHQGVMSAALRILPAAQNPPEILRLRLGVLGLRRTLAAVTRLLGSAQFGGVVADAPQTPPEIPAPPECPEIDGPVRRRLQELRRDLAESIEDSGRDPETWWRLRHLLKSWNHLEEVLGEIVLGEIAEPATTPSTSAPSGGTARTRALFAEITARDRATILRLSACRVLTSRNGGMELAPLIGGKAANLGEIERILGDAKVPPWFAVTDAAFQEILARPAGRAAAALGIEQGDSLPLFQAIEQILARPEMSAGRKSSTIRRLWQGVQLPPDLEEEIGRAYCRLGKGGEEEMSAGAALPDASLPDSTLPGTPLPGATLPDTSLPYVAIRSSAFEEDTQQGSWAGQFDTFLFVRGREAVLETFKLALASLWTERAIDHREMVGAPTRLGGGVLVQRIVHARAAGVLHTLSVTTGQGRDMIMNVGLGMGEGIVSGTVEVDHVVISRETDVLLDPLRFRYVVGDKSFQVVFDAKTGTGTRREETLYHQRLRPALEYTDLCEVVRAAARLEETYGYPLDMEFAFEQDQLSILQVRPIVAFQAALNETVEQYRL